MIKSLMRVFSTPNPYKVLGIPENASKDQIKFAYYRIAKKYHPDINSHYPVLFTKEYFAAVTQAYKELESHNFEYQAFRSSQGQHIEEKGKKEEEEEEEVIKRPKGRRFKVENDHYKKKKALFEVLVAVGATVTALLTGLVYASKHHTKKIINEQNQLMDLVGLERKFDEDDQVIRFYPKD